MHAQRPLVLATPYVCRGVILCLMVMNCLFDCLDGQTLKLYKRNRWAGSAQQSLCSVHFDWYPIHQSCTIGVYTHCRIYHTERVNVVFRHPPPQATRTHNLDPGGCFPNLRLEVVVGWTNGYSWSLWSGMSEMIPRLNTLAPL